MAKRKRTKGQTQTTKDPTTRISLKTEVNSGAPEGLTVPAPHVTHVVLLLSDTNIM